MTESIAKTLSDSELINEVLDRGLEEELIDLSEFSDSEIRQEYDDRGLDEETLDIDGDMSELYDLIHSGRPYEERLREIIYSHTGRIL